jgi:hypothetical protein
MAGVAGVGTIPPNATSKKQTGFSKFVIVIVVALFV